MDSCTCRIRVTGPSDDDEDWLVGENMDGSKSGGFPKDFIVPIEESEAAATSAPPPPQVNEPAPVIPESKGEEPKDEPSRPPVSILEPAPPSPQLDPSSRLPTPAIAPSPAPPSPAEPPAPTLPSAPAPPVEASQPKAPAALTATDPGSPPKPQSMKDRLAFFAAAQDKPAPPPIKPKPAAGGLTWSQRQKLRQEQEAKEREANSTSAPVSGPTATAPISSELPKSSADSAGAAATSTTSAEDKEGEGKGMSAADAASSITKGQSLKERMAALQNQGAFGSGGGEEKRPVAPVPSGKVWKRPPAPPAPVPEEEAEGDGSEAHEKVKSPVTEAGDTLDQASLQERAEGEDEAAPEEEEDEEEKEKARRAAIAARMAKLGARGPMGMMPPAKPARKPTKEALSPAEEKTAPVSIPPATPAAPPANQEQEVDQTPQEGTTPAVASSSLPNAESNAPETGMPKSIPIAAMPRRTAPPRRRGPAAASTKTPSAEEVRDSPKEPENRFEGTDENGLPVPPPQVMVAGEEDPLPKTDEQLKEEREAEEAAKGEGGIEGAKAAGIALAPVSSSSPRQQEKEVVDETKSQASKVTPLEPELPEEREEPLVGATGGADESSRGTGVIGAEGDGKIIDRSANEPQEIQEGLVEGGDEKDDILKVAQEGKLHLQQSSEDPLDEEEPTPLSPDPIGMVPLHPPADDGEIGEDDETPPLPPPRSKPRGLSMDIPLDELELKHEHEHTHDQPADNDEDGSEAEDIPPPLQSARRVSLDKPAGPRPLPSPGREGRALPPPPVGSAMIPPREDSDEEDEENEDDDDGVPPPPPARPTQPLASIDNQPEASEEDMPPPPPPARPVPQAAQNQRAGVEDEDILPPAAARSLPPPPAAQTATDEDEVPPPPPARAPPMPSKQPDEPEDEEDIPPPPPPARKPSLPAPIQTGVAVPAAAPKSTSPSSPVGVSSPTKSRTLSSEQPPASPKEEDEDATRRSGIAARMAKLGGIKFGMPPPTFKKSSRDVTSPPATEGAAPQAEEIHVDSPIDKEPPLLSPRTEQPAPKAAPVQAKTAEEGEETPEQESARRRATLARLRAGGALGGFGLFNPGGAPAETEDARGLEAEKAISADEPEDDEAPPPPPPARPPVPASRPSLDVPATPREEEEDVAPPPPPGRPQPTISTAASNEAASLSAKGPQTPSSPIPASPVRTPSGRRPPVPTEKRFSQTHRRSNTASSANAIIPEDRPTSITSDWQISDEPAVILSQQQDDSEDAAPPPPPPSRPPPPPQASAQPQQAPQSPPRRSGSFLSRKSRNSIDIAPPTPSKAPQAENPSSPVQPSPARQQSISRQPPPPPAHTASSAGGAGGRPGFDQLKEASSTYGAQLARSAHQIFSGGKRAQVGDGSPAGFVLLAIDQAQLPRPAEGWGQIVFEQEGGSILRRYDDPRPGDVAAFYDAKLKGKKGLSTYNQHVGSVQEPLVGVVAEFEDRKHKLRVLQVERGVSEEVSYRCEDLKSGKIIVYRPGL
uniref:BBC1/AIM3 cysteine proteinase-fold domain-containing protein n=1 Tax=Kwoniella dejecticola CBS 10117 TaxID=1296121 RepID=A0A1A6A2Z0_9TREE|nr:uncharacterized protein I303_05277 [Kwoniella dejecticola CBS 10117]OBR84419.1 hypothetical protein I303_05277 [Kwoniella dejecticola CBS 10117]